MWFRFGSIEVFAIIVVRAPMEKLRVRTNPQNGETVQLSNIYEVKSKGKNVQIGDDNIANTCIDEVKSKGKNVQIGDDNIANTSIDEVKAKGKNVQIGDNNIVNTVNKVTVNKVLIQINVSSPGDPNHQVCTKDRADQMINTGLNVMSPIVGMAGVQKIMELGVNQNLMPEACKRKPSLTQDQYEQIMQTTLSLVGFHGNQSIFPSISVEDGDSVDCADYPTTQAKRCAGIGHSHKVPKVLAKALMASQREAVMETFVMKLKTSPFIAPIIEQSKTCELVLEDNLCLQAFPECSAKERTSCTTACRNLQTCITDFYKEYKFAFNGACATGTLLTKKKANSVEYCHQMSGEKAKYFSYDAATQECSSYSGTCSKGDGQQSCQTFHIGANTASLDAIMKTYRNQRKSRSSYKSCPAGMARKPNSSDLISSSYMECCTPTCKTFACPKGFMRKSNASTILGNTSKKCCDKSCLSYVCPSNYGLKTDADSIRSTGDYATCCSQPCHMPIITEGVSAWSHDCRGQSKVPDGTICEITAKKGYNASMALSRKLERARRLADCILVPMVGSKGTWHPQI